MPSTSHGPQTAAERLHEAVTDAYDLAGHELALLAQACATLDDVDRLAAEVAASPVMVPAAGGGTKVHPAFAELRQQRTTLARLLVALRVPVDVDAADHDAPLG